MSKAKRYDELHREHKRYICEYIARLVKTVARPHDAMRNVARSQIGHSLWLWTAYAFDHSDGLVKQDRFKYNADARLATTSARVEGAVLRHEHVVPRGIVTLHIVEERMSAEQIMNLLDKYCHAVVVTKDEDKDIRPRSKMPPGWCWGEHNMFARYPARVLQDIVNPGIKEVGTQLREAKRKSRSSSKPGQPDQRGLAAGSQVLGA